ADYTEVWVPSGVVPLVRFADKVTGLASTGIGLVGVGDIPMPAGFAQKLGRFDSIVSWYGANNDDFRRAVPGEFHCALPPEDDPRHAVDFFAAQVGAPSGLVPRIRSFKSERRNEIVIHPFSGSAKKNWPLEDFRELARRLPLPVEWCAGERFRFNDLGEVASWLAGARLYIGNDTGITHLAAAQGVQTIAIFTASDPQRWAPRGENVMVLRNPSVAAVLDASARWAAAPR
ncbi:MAG: glycosyltransferase family 9 protein, partial [Bryobacteraceae bacterium]